MRASHKRLKGAQDLWQRDKYHFQKWAVEQVDGFVTTKRTADGGIDGRVYFAVPRCTSSLQSMVVEVKGGASVNVTDWRALKGVLSRDDALLAGLIVMEPLGPGKARNFAREVMDLEPLEILGIEYPRMQILTVADILDGKRFQTPTVAGRSPTGTATSLSQGSRRDFAEQRERARLEGWPSRQRG